MESLRILLVETSDPVRLRSRNWLEEAGFFVGLARNAEETRRLLRESRWNLVLLDAELPGEAAFETLSEIRGNHAALPAIMIAASPTVDGAARAIRSGALKYLPRPETRDHLVLFVKSAFETWDPAAGSDRRLPGPSASTRTPALLGRSPAIEEIRRLIDRIGRSHATTVLLLGETGTGKTLVARVIHDTGTRRDRPFLDLSCTALPENLLESELFGHEKGAFTDARTRKRGLLELADGGTVFLDEIGEMAPPLQGKLLRVIEDKSFRRLGGSEDIRVDVRLVAATNADLGEEVRQHRFREDLYYRLSVFPVLLPPLRERPEDIPELLDDAIAFFNRELGRTVRGVHPLAMQRLLEYRWPGNVRELRNVVERILILDDLDSIRPRDLPSRFSLPSAAPSPPGGGPSSEIPLPIGHSTLAEIELSAIRQALVRTGGNQIRAARLLGLTRDTLRYRMRKAGLLPLRGGAAPGTPGRLA